MYPASSKIFRQLMEETGTSVNQLAEMLGVKPQSVRNILYRGVNRCDDFVKIVSLMGGTVQVKTPGGKVFTETDAQPEEQKEKGPEPCKVQRPGPED